MTVSAEHIKELIKKAKDKTISKKELYLLRLHMQDDEIEALLDSIDYSDMPVLEPAFSSSAGKRYERIITAIKRPVTASLYYRYWVAAASIALLLSGSWLFYQHQQQMPTQVVKLSNSEFIQPALTSPEKVMLQLSDGRIILLDDADGDTTMKDGGTSLHLHNNQLVYENTGEKKESTRHTIITPRGRQVRIVLPDGTRVWLNTASTLVYPTQFDHDRREIELSGEAYFEVQKDPSKPFFIYSPEQEVEVLGTHFNVSAYTDDDATQTTLVEGRVKVRGKHNTMGSSPVTKILEPGQQAVMDNTTGAILVQEVETDDIISWKDNLFVFHNEEIKEVMKKVSRWYDLKIEYRDGMEGKRIGGSIPRFSNPIDLMESLKSTGLLNYKQEGGAIIIMK